MAAHRGDGGGQTARKRRATRASLSSMGALGRTTPKAAGQPLERRK